MKSTTGRGVKNCPSFPAEGIAEKLLEGKSFNIVAGLREIEAFESLSQGGGSLLRDSSRSVAAKRSSAL
jgi:hypothetical protein